MINIDYRSSLPLYEQIVAGVERLIHCGGLEKNQKLPSIRELSTELSINPNTIQKAYQALEQKKIIYSVKGRGSFVCDDTSAVLDARYSEILIDIRKNILEILHLKYDKVKLEKKLAEFIQKGGN